MQWWLQPKAGPKDKRSESINLKLDVIAEEVETHPQQHWLVELGCHQFQGFLYAPALPLKQLLVLAESTPEKMPKNCLPCPLPPS